MATNEESDDDVEVTEDDIDHFLSTETEEEMLDFGYEDENATKEESEPIFPGSNITKAVFMLLLTVFTSKYNIVGEGIHHLLKLFAFVLPKGHTINTSLASFKQFFLKLKNPLIKHYYCGECMTSISGNESTCPTRSCGKELTNKSYFVEVSVIDQLQVMNFYQKFAFHLILKV